MADISKIQGVGNETALALSRVQQFDPNSLVRERELGEKFALSEIVEPVKTVQFLFRLITPSQLEFFPEQQKTEIRNLANAFFNFLEQALAFDIESAQPTPAEAKASLITKANSLHQTNFNSLYQLISFATARTQDFSRLEQDARAASQAARDQVDELVAALRQQKESADSILTEVRAVAAEQGVSQQAIHFSNESVEHNNQAEIWKKWTIRAILAIGVYGVITLFLHKIPFFAPQTTYDAIQLSVSKILIFFVLAYSVALCSRNYLAHRHNAVVNKHRQNALATYTTIADAANDAGGRDIVLSHAAECISRLKRPVTIPGANALPISLQYCS